MENALGPDHPTTLDTVIDLARFYSKQGRMADAGDLYDRSLGRVEKALGSDHLLTLSTVNDLASVYSHQGRLDEAEALYHRVMAGREDALGPDHSLTLETVGNLVIILQKLGRSAEPEAMYDRALAGRESESLSTLLMAYTLASIYKDPYEFSKAMAMYERSLADKKARGSDDSSTLLISDGSAGPDLEAI